VAPGGGDPDALAAGCRRRQDPRDPADPRRVPQDELSVFAMHAKSHILPTLTPMAYINYRSPTLDNL